MSGGSKLCSLGLIRLALDLFECTFLGGAGLASEILLCSFQHHLFRFIFQYEGLYCQLALVKIFVLPPPTLKEWRVLALFIRVNQACFRSL
jgi:hypothetical protein